MSEGPEWVEDELARQRVIEQLAPEETPPMKYHFNVAPEAVWFLIVTAATPILLALVDFDPAKITDWQTWAVGLLAASVRAIAGALLAMRSGGFK